MHKISLPSTTGKVKTIILGFCFHESRKNKVLLKAFEVFPNNTNLTFLYKIDIMGFQKVTVGIELTTHHHWFEGIFAETFRTPWCILQKCRIYIRVICENLDYNWVWFVFRHFFSSWYVNWQICPLSFNSAIFLTDFSLEIILTITMDVPYNSNIYKTWI